MYFRSLFPECPSLPSCPMSWFLLVSLSPLQSSRPGSLSLLILLMIHSLHLLTFSSHVNFPATPTCHYPDSEQRAPNMLAFSSTHSYSANFLLFLVAIHSHQEPRSYREVVHHPHWQHAMPDELSTF